MPAKSRMVAIHRAVMEVHLGRRLRRDEVVHHINGDHGDNRIENLKLMSHGEHTSLHKRKFQECRHCGRSDVPNTTVDECDRCYQRRRRREEIGWEMDGSGRRKPEGIWGRSRGDDGWVLHDACIGCGTDERPHISKGRCDYCRHRVAPHQAIA